MCGIVGGIAQRDITPILLAGLQRLEYRGYDSAGLVARYWLEALAWLPCSVEMASELRYRHVAVQPGTLFVTLSQSGETADTMAALRFAKSAGYLATLAIFNVPDSSLVRESQLRLMTHAGPVIGVASTKAFTTQLAVLAWLALVMGRQRAG